MKKLLLFLIFPLFTAAYAQIPNGYYNSANGLSGTALQSALHNIIDNHTVISYSGLWTAFRTTDDLPNGKVWDMYSTCTWTFSSDQCGNYSGECDCYNREHSWPKSWFGDKAPMNSDLFHLYPTDGYVNGKRSNYPFGEVSTATYTSSNGCKVGSNTYPGYSGTVFEPIDEYKGDFARTYFYMSTRYYGEDGSWPGSGMTNGSQLKPWALAMMKEWHNNDPVSEKETSRNNAVYSFQSNRNPFIDHPEYVAAIWGGTVDVDHPEINRQLAVYPIPAVSNCTIDHSGFYSSDVTVRFSDLSGREFNAKYTTTSTAIVIDTESLGHGYYIVTLTESGKHPAFVRVIK
jgi:endonuclease I